LFRIYQNGIDIEVSNLYPPVEFPVSRTTPMIAPLIEWDHSENHFFLKHEDKVVTEKVFLIDLNDIDYSFVEGHTIDGNK
jgi:fatty acid synthase, animal type